MTERQGYILKQDDKLTNIQLDHTFKFATFHCINCDKDFTTRSDWIRYKRYYKGHIVRFCTWCCMINFEKNHKTIIPGSGPGRKCKKFK